MLILNHKYWIKISVASNLEKGVCVRVCVENGWCGLWKSIKTYMYLMTNTFLLILGIQK